LEQERRYEPTEKGQLERKDTFSELWRLMIIGYELQMEAFPIGILKNPRHCLVLSNRKRSALWSQQPFLEDSMAAGESVEPLQASKVHKKALFGVPPAGKDHRFGQ